MRRRLLTMICLALIAAALPATALAGGVRTGVTARSRSGITLFKSIGRVSLGMTPAQVRRALGRPSATDRFHGKITSYSYFGSTQLAISFDSIRHGDPADSILLNQGSDRTPQGIHVGSTKRQLKHAYRHLNCHASVCKIYQGAPLAAGTRDTEFIVATNGRVIGIAVEIQYE